MPYHFISRSCNSCSRLWG